ncbi:MAG: hypothetical protein J5580_03000 [Clostridia bacterium]|nr:hypothetical protein [Clostridia bacterium]
MKTYLKMFFKKLWAILVRIFLCCVPYLGYIRTGKKSVDTTEADDNVASETEKAE